MAVRNLKSRRAFVWIPPSSQANYKVTVTRSDGTVDVVTSNIINGKFEFGVSENIGFFKFKVPNTNLQYTDIWQGMETVTYYSDYAATPTTPVATYRVEKIDYSNNEVELSGRTGAVYVLEKKVTKTYEDEDIADILRDLFDSYGEGRYDTSEIPASTGITLTISWNQKNFWDAVLDITKASLYDCYVNASLVVKFFLRGSITNATDGIVHNYNLVEIGEFAKDIQTTKNRVIVYGGEIEGTQVIYTADDTVNQVTNGYGVREVVINDNSILTVEEAKAVAEFELSNLTDPPQTGKAKGFLLATVLPGEKVYISSPSDNVPPNSYTIVNIIHNVGATDYDTELTIERKPRIFSEIMKKRIEVENELQNTSSNPFEMNYSVPYLFNIDEGSHTNTQITSSVLKLQTGQTSGSWISPITAVSSNVLQAYIISNAQTPTGASYEISADGGVNYVSAVPGDLISIGNTGKQIVIRISINDTSTQIDSVNILYKLESLVQS